MTDHDRTDRASRSPFQAHGENEHRTEVYLLLRHFGQIQILELVHTGLREIVVVDAERQPRIVAILPGWHRGEGSDPRFVRRGVGERVVQPDEHDLF